MGPHKLQAIGGKDPYKDNTYNYKYENHGSNQTKTGVTQVLPKSK